MTSPCWSTEPFAGALCEVSTEALRRGAQVYRDSANKYPSEFWPIIYALAEALDCIAFLRDVKEMQ